MGAINSYSYDNQQYSPVKNVAVGALGVVAGWEGQTYITKKAKYPLGKYIMKNIKNVQGGGYLPYVQNAINQNNLQNDLKVIDLNPNNANVIKKQLKINFKIPKGKEKFIYHIMRLPSNNSSFIRTVKGNNAFFSSADNAVVCNFSKFGAPIFHEIQHKLNSKSSNPLIKTLAKVRNPLAVFGPLIISTCAIFTDKKENDEKLNIYDKIKKHCGVLTMLTVLPLTIEECIANIKGTNVAKKAGVTGEALKKVKACHKLSIISYVGAMLTAGLGAWAGNKIRDEICKLKTKPSIAQSEKA